MFLILFCFAHNPNFKKASVPSVPIYRDREREEVIFGYEKACLILTQYYGSLLITSSGALVLGSSVVVPGVIWRVGRGVMVMVDLSI